VSNKVFLYNSATGEQQAVSPYQGYLPKINGNFITWEILNLYHPPTGTATVQVYRLDTVKVSTVSESGGAIVNILDSGLLVFTLNSTQDVYVVNLNDAS